MQSQVAIDVGAIHIDFNILFPGMLHGEFYES